MRNARSTTTSCCGLISAVTFIANIGGAALALLGYLGQLVFLAQEVCISLVKGPIRWRQVIAQILEIGYRSQPVILVTGAFTGAVLTAQAMFQFQQVGMANAGGALVAVAMLRELGPSITALMLAGRIGSGMAAEIGTMQVTEQVDALRSMSVHPIDYLVTPRVIAILISAPLLISESVACGVVASYAVGVMGYDIPAAYWSTHISSYVDYTDIIVALVKGFAFALLIVVISCHQGLNASNGAVGVGRGTTRAMVYSSLAILIVNLLLTLILNMIFPAGLAT